LGVVARADHEATQVPFQDLRVLPLRAGPHGVTGERPGLVAVEPPQEDPSAIEEKAVGLKDRLPEPDTASREIDPLPTQVQRKFQIVENRAFDVPGKDVVQWGEIEIVNPIAGPGLHRGIILGEELGRFRQTMPGTEKPPFEPESASTAPKGFAQGARKFQFHRQSGFARPREPAPSPVFRHIGDRALSKGVDPRPRVEMGDMHNALHTQAYRPVDAPIDKIIHHPAKGRYGRILGRVHFHPELIAPLVLERPGNLQRKWSVGALVSAQGSAVEPNLAGDSDSLEIEEDPRAFDGFGTREFLIITDPFLIEPFVEITQRKLGDGMRQVDREAFCPFAHWGVIEKPVSV